jgi:hypothetical protein
MLPAEPETAGVLASWHPLPGKPRRDLHELIERLRRQTGSNAAIVLDEEEGTRRDVASIIDRCDMYVSADTTITAPVAEAIVRLRPVIISDGWGFDLSDQVIVIPNSEGKRTTPSMVAFAENGERKVGDPAKRQAITNPRKTIFSIKRFMGETFDDVNEGTQ